MALRYGRTCATIVAALAATSACTALIDTSGLSGAGGACDNCSSALDNAQAPDEREGGDGRADVTEGREPTDAEAGMPDVYEASVTPPTDPNCQYVLQARAYDVDDVEDVFVNGQSFIHETYGKDSQLVDLSSHVVSGTNTVRVTATNNGSGYAYGFAVYVRCALVYSASCGTVGVSGCPADGGLTQGVVLDHTITFSVP